MDSYKVKTATLPNFSKIVWPVEGSPSCLATRKLSVSTHNLAHDITERLLATLQIVTNLYVNETYVLYQCGTTAPDADVVPAGSKFFEIPLTSVTVVETIPYAYLVRPSCCESLLCPH